MTRSEYQELTEFLGKKFDAIDRRFTKVEVGLEENRHQTQIVAEGVTAVDRKLDRFKEEVKEEFRTVRSEMAEGFAAVRAEMDEGFRAQRRI